MIISKECIDFFLELGKKGIYLEGGVLNAIIDKNEFKDKEWLDYLKTAKQKSDAKNEETMNLARASLDQKSILNSKEEELKELNEKLKKENEKVSNSYKKIYKKNQELIDSQERERLANEEIKKQMVLVEEERNRAVETTCKVENDLKVLKEKNQLKLLNEVVDVCLKIIIGIGISTTLIFMVAIGFGMLNETIQNTWSQSILLMLSNSFSIIATIQGVKSISKKN